MDRSDCVYTRSTKSGPGRWSISLEIFAVEKPSSASASAPRYCSRLVVIVVWPMRQKYMIDGMPPTGPAWSVATTGVASWILRGIAVVIGLVCVVTMTVATIGTGLIVLAVLGSVHR